ncbi:hypothetical protein BANRA_03490 [Escherichia coli]|nr:hypothetical protein BANRA_03490 [Escherichia coli]
MIDSCVARLRKYKPEEYELVIAHFIIGISLRTIAKKQKCSDGTIRKDYRLQWIHRWLFKYFVNMKNGRYAAYFY